MEQQVPYVSVVDPIGPAIERVKTVLFRPFDLGRWFIIGFCAWLAQLGDPGGGGGGNGSRHEVNRGDIRHEFDHAREYVVNNLDWLIPLAAVAVVVFIGVWLLLLWISSHGRFMFLYCVAQNKAEVRNPWHRFRSAANSLFAFRAVVGLITLAAAIVPFLIGGIIVAATSATIGFNVLSVMGIVAAVMYFIAVMIVAASISKFTKDFVVPIMYLHTGSSVRAWQILLDLMSANAARFVLYILVQIAIAIAIGAMLMASVCCTCCCAACLFAIPYIGTVILLPVHVFGRSYSLYYLAQYGPQFNAFELSPGATAANP